MTLTSKETWQPPGLYYFDVVLMQGNSSVRVLLASVNLVGGPTNHNVRHDQDQNGFILMDPVEITPDGPNSIAIKVPFVTDPPENIVEGVVGDPKYVVQPLDDPHRHILIRNYGPRVSLMMTLKVPHDHTNHNYRFDQFFLNGNIPAPCPLKDGYIQFNNRRVNLNLTRPMHAIYHRFSVHHSPEITYDGGFGEQLTDKPFYMDDNVVSGQITWHLNDGNDQIHIDARHFIPDDHGGFEIWMLRIDWFNWVDPYEPDPERDDVTNHYNDGCPIADTWPGFWPPDMWYCYDDTEYAKTKGRNTVCPGSLGKVNP